MNQKLLKSILFFSVVLFSQIGFSQDEKSLDDEFATDAPLAPPAQIPETPNPMPSVSGEISIDQAEPLTFNKKGDENDLSANTNLATPIEVLQSQNALYGFSLGVVYSTQPFTANYVIKSDFGEVSRSAKIDNIQSIGVIFRYAIVPFGGIGTDLNISYLTSQNHGSINYTPIKTLKGEVNLSYAVNLGKTLPLYILLGLGAEEVTGHSIEEKINKRGNGAQAGAGLTIGSIINLEAMYTYYEHRLSNSLVEREQKANGDEAGHALINTADSKIVSQGILVRTTYSFK